MGCCCCKVRSLKSRRAKFEAAVAVLKKKLATRTKFPSVLQPHARSCAPDNGEPDEITQFIRQCVAFLTIAPNTIDRATDKQPLDQSPETERKECESADDCEELCAESADAFLLCYPLICKSPLQLMDAIVFQMLTSFDDCFPAVRGASTNRRSRASHCTPKSQRSSWRESLGFADTTREDSSSTDTNQKLLEGSGRRVRFRSSRQSVEDFSVKSAESDTVEVKNEIDLLLKERRVTATVGGRRNAQPDVFHSDGMGTRARGSGVVEEETNALLDEDCGGSAAHTTVTVALERQSVDDEKTDDIQFQTECMPVAEVSVADKYEWQRFTLAHTQQKCIALLFKWMTRFWMTDFHCKTELIQRVEALASWMHQRVSALENELKAMNAFLDFFADFNADGTVASQMTGFESGVPGKPLVVEMSNGAPEITVIITKEMCRHQSEYIEFLRKRADLIESVLQICTDYGKQQAAVDAAKVKETTTSTTKVTGSSKSPQSHTQGTRQKETETTRLTAAGNGDSADEAVHVEIEDSSDESPEKDSPKDKQRWRSSEVFNDVMKGGGTVVIDDIDVTDDEMEETAEDCRARGSDVRKSGRLSHFEFEHGLDADSAKCFAQQLTYRDFALMKDIDARQYLFKVTGGKLPSWIRALQVESGTQTGGVLAVDSDTELNARIDWYKCCEKQYYAPLQRLIESFGKVHRSVVVNVVLAPSLELRIAVISFYITVCAHLLNLGNYYSFVAVCQALNSSNVSVKLKAAFGMVTQSASDSYLNYLQPLLATSKNWMAFRTHVERAANNGGKVILPFSGLVLQDLTFTNDGCKDSFEWQSTASGRMPDFVKFKRFQAALRYVLAFERHSERYSAMNKCLREAMHSGRIDRQSLTFDGISVWKRPSVECEESEKPYPFENDEELDERISKALKLFSELRPRVVNALAKDARHRDAVEIEAMAAKSTGLIAGFKSKFKKLDK